MRTKDSNSPVEVFAGTAVDAALVQSLLSNAEIESYLQNDLVGTIAPWISTVGGVAPVKIVVAVVDVEKAQQVIRDYYAALSVPNSDNEI